MHRILIAAIAMTLAPVRPALAQTPVVVYNAGSLARPLKVALDGFAAHASVVVQQENAGSLESARKLTELHKIPDIIALADEQVFGQLLMPSHTTWYLRFARNRMVLAYTPQSKFADQITAKNWYDVLTRAGVETGRADPNLDPNGYRTLFVLQLAEAHYHQPGLASRVLAAIPPRNVRAKSEDLVALLQAGELDYAWEYESVARAAQLRYVRLPDDIDLSDVADSAAYARAHARVAGKSPGDTVTVTGSPIVYGLSIPTDAPHRDAAVRAVAWMFSDAGKKLMRDAQLDVLDVPMLVGSGAPPAIASLAAKH